MKIILSSDWHIREKNPICRLDNIFNVQFNKLDYIFKYANNHNAIILQAGDFFDKPRSYILLQEVINLFNLFSDIKIYAVEGQHDQYLRSDQSSNFSILNKTGYIKKLTDNPAFINDEITLYGCSWNQKVPKVSIDSLINILVVHAPIAMYNEDTKLLNHIEYNKASSFLKKHKDFDLILCGDIHNKFIHKLNNRIICNTGPLLRTTVDDHITNHKPGFYIYDTKKKTIKWEEIPHSVSYEVITKEHIERKNEISNMLEDFINRIQDQSSFEGIDIIKSLRKIIQKRTVKNEIRNILADLIASEGM